MVERKFFVEFNTHNAKTDAWNYKQTKAFADYDTARKEFYNVLATYIQYGDLDHVSAILFDSYGNMLDHSYWEAPAPESTPEEQGGILNGGE